MQTKEFLEQLWPTTGTYCIVGKDASNKLTHRFVDDIDQALSAIEYLNSQKLDVYFACSTYKTPHAGRTQVNTDEQRSFWIDLDCGMDKKRKVWKDYKTQHEALVALRAFCDTTGLPAPMLVNSGNGIHAYWIMEEAIPTHLWKPLADGLKFLCVKHDLRADPACTSDSARILRVPGTFNYKDPENPVKVAVLAPMKPVAYQDLAALIPVQIQTKAQPIRTDSFTDNMFKDKKNSFQKILKRCATRDGCEQLAHIVKNQRLATEPMWRSALSIAKFCEDHATAIHSISKLHPDYSYAATERKVAMIPKPHTCKQFESYSPSRCDGCKHQGKITTPLQLGRIIPKAVEGAIDQEFSTVTAMSESLGEEQQYRIPPYPEPYFRGKDGGVYKALPDDAEDGMKIYDNDFYVVERLMDPDPLIGECAWFRLHLPHDGVREFIVPTAVILSKDKARDLIVSKGVIAYGKKLDHIIEYVSVAVETLQNNKGAQPVYKQYGWNDSQSKILIGNREISAFGTKFVPVATALNNVNKTLTKKGSFEEWKSAINTYGRPGMELRAFGLFCGFGSLLMPFLEQPSAVINFYNPESGQGKTAILKAMTSIYGDPAEDSNLMLMYGDTMNAIVNRLGYMGSLPQAIDEMTDAPAQDIQQLVKFVTGKRGKNRMVNGVNGERMNDTTFNLIVAVSSNTDWRKVMFAHKAVASGEVNRFIQLKIEQDKTLTKSEASAIFDKLHHNYGHAGEKFAEWLVKNVDLVKTNVAKMQARIDKDFEITGKDRFFSATFAAVFMAAAFAKSLGLHDIELHPVYDAIRREMAASRVDMKERNFNAIDALADFINTHLRDILVINGNVDKRSGVQQAPIVKPMNSLRARIEPDTQIMFIPVQALKDYCNTIKVDHTDFVLGLKRAGVYMKNENKALNKGLDTVAPATRCVWINIADLDQFNPQNLDLDIPKNVN
jgi:hypothetical protein